MGMPYFRTLRASAWTMFTMGVLHLLGHWNSARAFTQPPDEPTKALVAAMMGYVVKDLPVDRTAASLYLGFSLFFSAASMLLGALVLLAATALQDQPAKLRPLVRAYAAGLLVLVAVSMNYFIWPPTVCLLVALGLAAFSMARLRKAA
jgi:hypothetical protein